MDSSDERSKAAAGLMRDNLDWLLLLALGSLLPWLAIYCTDFWYRTDYRFFPLLIVTTLVVTVWLGLRRRENLRSCSPLRSQFGGGMWLAGGLLGLGGALWFSPWLAMASLTIVWMAWTLMRLGQHAWSRVISWALPMASVLLLPLSEATDPFFDFTALVTASANNLLDLLSIPQLPTEHSLELRSGQLDVSNLCRGIGNPYLLGALTILLCLIARPSWLVCLLTVASVPAWAWGGSVLLVTIGSLLAESYQIYIMLGYRLWIVQAVVLGGGVLSIWLFQRGLVKLLSPFTAYSEGVGGVHKFFNTVVLWPEPDPLRKRKQRDVESENVPSSSGNWTSRYKRLILIGAAGLFATTGAIIYFRMSSPNSAGASIWQLALPPSVQSANLASLVLQEALPGDFSGMQLVGFDSLLTPGTATAGSRTAAWTYAHQSRTVQLKLVVPQRGFYPRERLWLSGGNEVTEPRQAVDVGIGNDGISLLLDELTIKESIAGPSYLAYATWSPEGQINRGIEITEDWTWSNLLNSITYQPTTFSLSLYVAGHSPNAIEREEYRKILMEAVRSLGKSS